MQEQEIDLFKENKTCVCYFDTQEERDRGHVQGCYHFGKPFDIRTKRNDGVKLKKLCKNKK